MADIRYIKLMNGGGFVAQMIVHYDKEENGNVVHKKYEESGYHDVTVGFDRTIDLSKTGIPDGSPVSLEVNVVWGKNNQASQTHTYRASSTKMACYVITGTTLSNTMGEERICDH